MSCLCPGLYSGFRRHEEQLVLYARVALALAAALLSITLNPLAFAAANWLGRRAQASPRLHGSLETSRAPRFAALEAELDQAREIAEQRAAAHHSFSPEELVERFPLSAELSPEQREVVALHVHAQDAQPGERVIRIGDPPDAVYFISSGLVEVAVGDKRVRLQAGDFFDEMALLGDRPRSADVTTLDYCRFVTLNRRDFREVLRRYPAIRKQFDEAAAQCGQMNQQES